MTPDRGKRATVSCFVDPDIVNDPNARDIDAIALSYTMFRAKDDAPAARAASPAQPASLQ
jgi:cytochrome c oxidase assembly protein Cox11